MGCVDAGMGGGFASARGQFRKRAAGAQPSPAVGSQASRIAGLGHRERCMSNRRAQLGMALFLLNEAVFFFMLILAFVHFHDVRKASLHLRAASVDTAFLIASSFTMWRAVRTGARHWLALTVALGSFFLIGQGSEYISRQRLGTAFFTLTSLHGLHLLVGI